MSWLYTIVFAGLLFSSHDNAVQSKQEDSIKSAPVIEAVSSDEIEKFEQSYPLNANGRVSVSNVNGSITVEAWDKNEVKLEAVKIADSKESLAEVEIIVDSSADSFSVEANYDNWKNRGRDGWKNNRKLEVQFHLIVPRNAVLNEVETVNGSVTVSNFANYTKISAVNGSVKATNLRGTANLSTVNGNVIADFDRLETGSKISLCTVNGEVNLIIPSDSNATLRADSLNATITNDFGLPVRKGQYVGRDLYGKIGTGDVQIKLSSVNGVLAIGRKNDGKNLSPATNLLPQKGKDDEDWDEDEDNDNDIDVDVDTEKMNKEISRAVKGSTKVSAKAAKEAQKEIVKIKPEIAKITAESVKTAAEAIKQTAEVLNSEELKQKIQEAQIREANWMVAVPRIEKKSNTFAVKGTPKVTIDARECAVKVRGWDKQEVQYVVTKISSSRRQPAIEVKETHTDSEVNLTVTNTGNTLYNSPTPPAKPEGVEVITIKDKKVIVKHKDGSVTEEFDLTDAAQKAAFERKYGKVLPLGSPPSSPSPPEGPDPSTAPKTQWNWNFDMFGGPNQIRIEVFVPKKSNLKIITNGEIRLEGVSGDVELNGGNEAVNVRDVDGKLRLVTAEGRVRIIGFKGELDSQTDCGDVYLEGDFDKLSARTTDGKIIMTLPENSNFDVQANVEEIETENLPVPKQVAEGNWRFGKGGAKYSFTAQEGHVIFRGAGSLTTDSQ